MSSVCQWNEVLKITWEMNGEDSWTSIRLCTYFSPPAESRSIGGQPV
jgi:hypothetical protein